MRMRVLTTKLRVEIENEMRVFLESLNFEIEMRVSQKSAARLQFSTKEYSTFLPSICATAGSIRNIAGGKYLKHLLMFMYMLLLMAKRA